jgi:hypothetical protein
MLAALFLILAAPPTPIPPSAEPPPGRPSPVGEWVLEWSGGEGPCVLNKDGSFSCFWGGSAWQGLWTLEGDTLAVSEWIPARDEWTPASQHLKWSVTLENGLLAGKLDAMGAGAGGRFRLRKRDKE